MWELDEEVERQILLGLASHKKKQQKTKKELIHLTPAQKLVLQLNKFNRIRYKKCRYLSSKRAR
jgi:hypothetical protein